MQNRGHSREGVIFTSKKKTPNVQQLTEIEEKFIRTIWELHYVTIPQLTTLHYKQTTRSILNYVAAILKQLDDEQDEHSGKHVHKNYVQRGFLGRAVRYGR